MKTAQPTFKIEILEPRIAPALAPISTSLILTARTDSKLLAAISGLTIP